MKRLLCSLIVLWVPATSVLASVPVAFADPNLKDAVEKDLWVLDPTPTDMLGLTSLSAYRRQITSLVGLEHAVNLRSLTFGHNRITDLTPLSGLSNLTRITMNTNRVRSLAPLAGLHNLTHLDMHDNDKISDLSPLAGLTALTTIILRINDIRDLSPLSGLHSLTELNLEANDISDLSPLNGLGSLRELRLGFNQISDVTSIAGLTGLGYLDLRFNRVGDISALTSFWSLYRLNLEGNPLSQQAYDIHLPQIRANNPGILIEVPSRGTRTLSISSTVGGSVTQPGEGEFAYDEDALVRLEAKADPGFLFTGWSGSVARDENPTWITMSRNIQIQATFISVLTELFVDNSALDDLPPGDPLIGTLPQDGSVTHPFHSIQRAIVAATDGATIIVRPGVYRENINLLGKKIHLVAIDPDDPNAGPCAVIEGAGTGPVVRIGPGSGAECSIAGFVITQGKGPLAAALHCSGSSPTISNCLIVGNRCIEPNGSILYFFDSRAVLTNCTIADNHTGPEGAAVRLIDSDIVMIDSILWGNDSGQIDPMGKSTPSIRYCNVQGGWPDLGNIDADPLFAQRGSWVDPDDPDKVLTPLNPYAVWIGGDYRLKSQAGRWDPAAEAWVLDERTSPCIDAGSPDSPVGPEPMPNGGRINLGAYGGTSEAGKSLVPVAISAGSLF